MRYDLDNEYDRLSSQVKFNKMLEERKHIELTDKSRRSRKQNSYLHLIITFLALQIGETVDYVKLNFYKLEANRNLFYSYKMQFGKKRAIIRSSRDLTTEEMSLSIERFKDWSAKEALIPLPDAENEKALLAIEREASRAKQYL